MITILPDLKVVIIQLLAGAVVQDVPSCCGCWIPARKFNRKQIYSSKLFLNSLKLLWKLTNKSILGLVIFLINL